MHEIYNREYFEDGLATGKSLYTGFRWMPERSFREAIAIIDACEIKPGVEAVLDFGCAKGFLVKALRLLNRDAFGCDVSRYAVCTADPSIRQFIRLCTPVEPFPFEGKVFDLCIAKDVLEHLEEDELDGVLEILSEWSRRIFVAIPIGDGKRFIVPEYNYDATHKIAQTTKWWEKMFKFHNLEIEKTMMLLKGIKDNWSHYEQGNRFYVLRGK